MKSDDELLRGKSVESCQDKQRRARYFANFEFDTLGRIVVKNTKTIVIEEDPAERIRLTEEAHQSLNHAKKNPMLHHLKRYY